MLYKRFIQTLFITLTFSQFALGALSNIDIVKITNDEDNEVAYMFVGVDKEGTIMSFGYKSFLADQIQTFQEFNREIGYAGIVLKKQSGKDIVILRSLNLDFHHGGSLEIDFLKNALTDSREKFAIELDRTSDAWQLTKSGRIIHHLHFVSNKKPGLGTIGIKSIEIIN